MRKRTAAPLALALVLLSSLILLPALQPVTADAPKAGAQSACR